MTRQEIFDKAYLGMASQGFRASLRRPDSNSSAYRAPDGCRCSIGWVIPDNLYDPVFEGLRYVGYCASRISMSFSSQKARIRCF